MSVLPKFNAWGSKANELWYKPCSICKPHGRLSRVEGGGREVGVEDIGRNVGSSKRTLPCVPECRTSHCSSAWRSTSRRRGRDRTPLTGTGSREDASGGEESWLGKTSGGFLGREGEGEMEKGMERGREEGMVPFLRILRMKIGNPPPDMERRIRALSQSELEELAEDE